jgi:hypothetical protein
MNGKSQSGGRGDPAPGDVLPTKQPMLADYALLVVVTDRLPPLIRIETAA